jgi:hypothetical protein
VLGGAVLADQDTWPDVGDREERHRIAARLVQQDHVLAVGDPFVGEPDAQSAPERLGEQHSWRERLGGQEAADRRAAQRARRHYERIRQNATSTAAERPRGLAAAAGGPAPTGG